MFLHIRHIFRIIRINSAQLCDVFLDARLALHSLRIRELYTFLD